MNNTDLINNENIELPKEEYVFRFSEEELDRAKNGLVRKGNYILVAFLITGGLFLVYDLYLAFDSRFTWLLVGAYLCMLFLVITSKIKNNKKWKNDRSKISECTYEYKLFEEYMYLYIYKCEGEFRKSKVYYKDIVQMTMADGYLNIVLNEGLYLARCSDLNKDSHLFACMRKFEYNKKAPKIKRKK